MSGSPRSFEEPPIKVLNGGDSVKIQHKSALDVSKDLQKLMLRLKGSYITEDGLGVDYKELRNSKMFTQYKEITKLLPQVDLATLSDNEKFAFFINIYNALTIHGLVACENLPDSVLSIQLFWKSTAYKIGPHVFSLDDIEHGVLRSNRPHPASKTPPFSDTDPRLKYKAKKLDPRIHFALNCGAKSCPAIQVYSESNLDAALTSSTVNFLSQELKVFEIQKQVHISKIFQWYVSDFGENDIDAIRWTVPYLPATKQEELKSVLRIMETHGMVDIFYRDYDWKLNKKIDILNEDFSHDVPLAKDSDQNVTLAKDSDCSNLLPRSTDA